MVQSLLTDIGSFSGYPLDPGQHYLYQVLDIDLRVESETIWDNELRDNVTIASDHPKHHDVDWVFSFYQHQYELVLRLRAKHSEIFVGKHAISKFLEEWIGS